MQAKTNVLGVGKNENICNRAVGSGKEAEMQGAGWYTQAGKMKAGSLS